MDLDGPEYDEHDATPPNTPAATAEPDLERIAGDLADVEQALERLDRGSYWTDEITGEPLSDALLAEDPTARRATYIPHVPEADTDEPPPSA